MNANELRINNWVQDTIHFKGYFQVQAISSVHITTPEWRLSEDNVAPIPLTEDWLKRAGFENNVLNAKHNDIRWMGDHIAVSGMLGLIKPVDCKHVHQLQNLYFALTGEELQFASV